MPISCTADQVLLAGVCQVEEAERLRGWLSEHPCAAVNLGELTYLHSAVLQVLMAARRPVTEWPADTGLAQDLARVLTAGADASPGRPVG